MRSVFSSSKLLAHADRIFGDNRRPITADIFLTNYCNNACSYCNYKRWEHSTGARYISLADFVKYAERLRQLGVKGIILTGGGEPTISPDFNSICAWLEKEQIPYGVNSNLLRYPGEICPRFLKVSLDASCPEDYSRKRGVDVFSEVVANIKRYASKKGAETRLGVQLLAEHYEEVTKFVPFAKTLPVDYISVRPVESTAGAFYTDPARKIEGRLIQALLEYEHGADPRVLASPKWGFIAESQPGACPAAWCQIAVDERGQVMYCCQRPYDIVGNLMDDDILDKKLRYTPDMALCDHPCRLTGYNVLMQSLPAGFNDVEFI